MKKHLLAALLLGAVFSARAQAGTYSPAYYRNLELKQKPPTYAKQVRATLAYEVAHMKKFVVGSFAVQPRGGFAYSFANTAQYAHLMRCTFTVLFKNSANQVLGKATGYAYAIAPGEKSSRDQVNIVALPPVGTAAGDIIINTVTAE